MVDYCNEVKPSVSILLVFTLILFSNVDGIFYFEKATMYRQSLEKGLSKVFFKKKN